MTWRKLIASLLLLAFAGLHVMGWWWMRDWTGLVWAGGCLAAVTALWARWGWARWFALGIGVTGVVGCAGVLLALPSSAFAVGDRPFLAGQALAFSALAAVLSGRRMREAYEQRAGWPASGWRDRTLGLAVICSVGISAMLLRRFGLWWHGEQPLHLLGSGLALLAAVFGAILTYRRRTAGLLLLGLAGGAAVIAGVDSVRSVLFLAPRIDGQACSLDAWQAYQRLAHAAMAGAGLATGALTALAALAVFLGPMIAFLRRR